MLERRQRRRQGTRRWLLLLLGLLLAAAGATAAAAAPQLGAGGEAWAAPLHRPQQHPRAAGRRLLVGISDAGWVATWISKALSTGDGVLMHPVLRPGSCLDGGGGPLKGAWTTFYAITWPCNNRAWQFWRHNGYHLFTNMSWKQAWRDFCLRRADATAAPADALVSSCDDGLNQIAFVPDHDTSGRLNPELHPRTDSVMFRVVWRPDDPASRAAFCLTDYGGDAPSRFEPCRGGALWELPFPSEDDNGDGSGAAGPPYTVFTDPVQLWTIPRPFSGVDTGAAGGSGGGSEAGGGAGAGKSRAGLFG